MVRPPYNPSFSRRLLLAPLTLAYLAASTLHRALLLRPRGDAPSLPLWVIGSLRAGGAAKTAVTLELARRLAAEGKRVGILTYRIGKNARSRDPLSEVFARTDWREASDEAVLLARESGARVFATRRRDLAWRRLAALEQFDILLSDDGLLDARLAGAHRIALARPGERPGWSALLPAGSYRLTADALRGADQVWYGPLNGDRPAKSGEAGKPGFEPGFTREPVLPEGLDPERSYWGLCGLADPASFTRALERAGVRLAGLTAGPDHGLPDLETARRDARQAGAAGFLYSAKDAIKLEGLLEPGESAGRVDERVTFVPEPPPLPHAPGRAPSS